MGCRTRFLPARFRPVALVGAVLVLACGSDGPTSPPRATRLERITSTPLAGTPGLELADSVRVRALDAGGHPVAGAVLSWSTTNGGSAAPATDTTDTDGIAAAAWRLGRPEGTQQLRVAAGPATSLVIQASATTLHAVSLTSGDGWNCALDAGGRALCWGLNRSGQLGRGRRDFFQDDTAVAVSGGHTFTMLTAAKAHHTCGLAPDGAAYCWGRNVSGALGSGALGDTLAVPTAVATNLRFTEISANGTFGSTVTCGRTARNEVWCWGSDATGQLGDSTLVPGPGVYSITPVRIQSAEAFARVKVGFYHSCAVTLAQALWCWGQQQADTGAFGLRAPGIYRTPVAVAPGYRFQDMAFGNDLTCGLAIDHIVYCWGLNWFGGLGSGQAIHASAQPLPVAGNQQFQSLANGGFEQIFGLGMGGEPYTWGSPACCDLAQATPLLLTAEVTFVGMDGQPDPFEACGITPSGAVYCTGWDGRPVHGVPVAAP